METLYLLFIIQIRMRFIIIKSIQKNHNTRTMSNIHEKFIYSHNNNNRDEKLQVYHEINI